MFKGVFSKGRVIERECTPGINTVADLRRQISIAPFTPFWGKVFKFCKNDRRSDRLTRPSRASRQQQPIVSEELTMASLNKAQMQAVCTPPNSVLQILAGPGSGKTKVLTHRVCFLLQ